MRACMTNIVCEDSPICDAWGNGDACTTCGSNEDSRKHMNAKAGGQNRCRRIVDENKPRQPKTPSKGQPFQQMRVPLQPLQDTNQTCGQQLLQPKTPPKAEKQGLETKLVSTNQTCEQRCLQPKTPPKRPTERPTVVADELTESTTSPSVIADAPTDEFAQTQRLQVPTQERPLHTPPKGRNGERLRRPAPCVVTPSLSVARGAVRPASAPFTVWADVPVEGQQCQVEDLKAFADLAMKAAVTVQQLERREVEVERQLAWLAWQTKAVAEAEEAERTKQAQDLDTKQIAAEKARLEVQAQDFAEQQRQACRAELERATLQNEQRRVEAAVKALAAFKARSTVRKVAQVHNNCDVSRLVVKGVVDSEVQTSFACIGSAEDEPSFVLESLGIVESSFVSSLRAEQDEDEAQTKALSLNSFVAEPVPELTNESFCLESLEIGETSLVSVLLAENAVKGDVNDVRLERLQVMQHRRLVEKHAAFQRQLAAMPAEAWWAMGEDRARTGDLQGALQDYCKAIELNPNDEWQTQHDLTAEQAVLKLCRDHRCIPHNPRDNVQSSQSRSMHDRASLSPFHIDAAADASFEISGTCDSSQIRSVIQCVFARKSCVDASDVVVTLVEGNGSAVVTARVLADSVGKLSSLLGQSTDELREDVMAQAAHADPPLDVVVQSLHVGAVAPDFIKCMDRTTAFVELVEESSERVTCEELLQQKAPDEFSRRPLATDPIERQKELVHWYTADCVYPELNSCLLLDNRNDMVHYAGFIHELRDVFQVGLGDRVVQPFKGKCRRGMTIANVEAFIAGLQIGEEFMFPTFTSTTTSSVVPEAFRGTIELEFSSASVGAKKGNYSPARVSELSEYPEEDEVLWPPHVRTRLHNIRFPRRWAKVAQKMGIGVGSMACDIDVPVLQLETTELPSVWHMIERADIEAFDQWAQNNPDRMRTTGCRKSIINAVARSAIKDGAGDKAVQLFKRCISAGADVNERDPKTGFTPVVISAEAAKGGGDACLAVLKACIEAKCDQSGISQAAADLIKRMKLDNVHLAQCARQPFVKVDGKWNKVETPHTAQCTADSDVVRVQRQGTLGIATSMSECDKQSENERLRAHVAVLEEELHLTRCRQI